MEILERFFRYISIDTTSNPFREENPSNDNERELAELLVNELRDLGLEVHYDEKHCYVYGVLKGKENLKSVGFISHMDTSCDAVGKDIKPRIIQNYDGRDVNFVNGVIMETRMFPDLKKHIGKTLITTDGTTLLGTDDKAGIAEIMTMLEYIINNDVTCGDIFVAFTPDEEIGLGTLNFDLKYFYPEIAFTVDGSCLGEFSYENFNAATAKIEITGVLAHRGYAKDIMINAGRVAALINSYLPEEVPENTCGKEGFYSLESIVGDVSSARMEYLIRDFDRENFERRKEMMRAIVDELNEKYNNAIKLDIKDTYYNMFETFKDTGIVKEIEAAILNVGVQHCVESIRGGTDGTQISFMGIPCPNLGTGGHNFHSIYEYICLEDMEKTVEILVSCVKQLSKSKVREENAKEFILQKKS